jgi:hypothetical protein
MKVLSRVEERQVSGGMGDCLCECGDGYQYSTSNVVDVTSCVLYGNLLCDGFRNSYLSSYSFKPSPSAPANIPLAYPILMLGMVVSTTISAVSAIIISSILCCRRRNTQYKGVEMT